MTGFIGKASHFNNKDAKIIEMRECHTDGMSIYFRDFDVNSSGMGQFSTSMIFGYLGGRPELKLSMDIYNCSAKNGGMLFSGHPNWAGGWHWDGNCVSGCIAANEGNGFINLYGCEADVDFIMDNCVRNSLAYYLAVSAERSTTSRTRSIKESLKSPISPQTEVVVSSAVWWGNPPVM